MIIWEMKTFMKMDNETFENIKSQFVFEKTSYTENQVVVAFQAVLTKYEERITEILYQYSTIVLLSNNIKRKY